MHRAGVSSAWAGETAISVHQLASSYPVSGGHSLVRPGLVLVAVVLAWVVICVALSWSLHAPKSELRLFPGDEARARRGPAPLNRVKAPQCQGVVCLACVNRPRIRGTSEQ